MFNCSKCNEMLSQSGLLIVRLKKATNQIHTTENHNGEWHRCVLEPCVTNFRAIRGEITDVSKYY